MSFLNFEVNDFVGTLYNMFCLCTVVILFGLALNIEYVKDRAKYLKRLIQLNKILKGLEDIEQ